MLELLGRPEKPAKRNLDLMARYDALETAKCYKKIIENVAKNSAKILVMQT